jgi:ABC-type sugar transport system permease subunit
MFNLNAFDILYFSTDNAHIITSFDVQIMRICQLAVELGSADRGRRNSLQACVLLVVIVVMLSLMKTSFGVE